MHGRADRHGFAPWRMRSRQARLFVFVRTRGPAIWPSDLGFVLLRLDGLGEPPHLTLPAARGSRADDLFALRVEAALARYRSIS